jgi:hypothetical protein
MAPHKKKPTIEQRLEATNQTLELVAAMQLVTERELAKASKTINDLGDEISRLSRFTNAALTIHEARILKLERKKG